MLKPTTQLVNWIVEKQLPWISYNDQIGRVELIIDNHLLSTYRQCPAYFMLYAVEGIRPKPQPTPTAPGGVPVGERREWFLDFGILWHKLMEEYYSPLTGFRSPGFTLQGFAVDTAKRWWDTMQMDKYLSHPECQKIGGFMGFAVLLVGYSNMFSSQNERLQWVASEISFGKNKEVPIYTLVPSNYSTEWSICDIYLSGRIDLLFDDGTALVPMDHKTLNSFRRDPLARFLIDDGPTGYIYAMQKILPTIVGAELLARRTCNSILMSLICKGDPPKNEPPFKRLPIFKSAEALEMYRQRQVATCNNIMSDLESYIRGQQVQRNTTACTNYYFYECPYYDIHRQQSIDAERKTIHNGFVALPVWNTERMNEE